MVRNLILRRHPRIFSLNATPENNVLVLSGKYRSGNRCRISSLYFCSVFGEPANSPQRVLFF